MGRRKEKMEEEEGGKEREEGRKEGEEEGRGKASLAELFSSTVFYFHIRVINTTQQNFQQSKHHYHVKFVIPS